MNILYPIRQAVDPRLRLRALPEQRLEWPACGLRQGVQLRCQRFDPLRSFRGHNSKLGHARADRIAGLGNLPDEKVPRAVQYQGCGVCFALHRNEPH